MKHIGAIVVLLSMFGCTTFKAADEGISKTKTAAQSHLSKGPSQGKVVTVVDDYWVSTAELPQSALDKLPEPFKKAATIRAESLPFEYVANSVMVGSGLRVKFGSTLNRKAPVSVDFRGDLFGALDAVANSAGFRWEYRDGAVVWDDLASQTWVIPMPPGASSYLSRVGGSVTTTITSASASSSAGGATGGTAGGHDGGQGGNGGTGTAQQTTREATRYSIWTDLEQQIEGMLSTRGRVSISEATSTVTVRDYPDRINSVDTVVRGLIQQLTSQVAIEVTVIEVQLNDSAAYGIDWALVKNAISGFGYTLNTNTAGTVFPGGGNPPALTINYVSSSSSVSGSSALVQALETQGKVGVLTQPRVITLNNQLASLQVGTEVGYLAKSETTVSGTSNATTTALTPGVVRDGFMMYALPRVMRNEIVLQMAVTMNTLTNIRRVGSADGSSVIEIPEVVTKNFSQLSKLRNGESMVMAGFRQMGSARKNSGISRFLGPLAGSVSAEQNRVDTVLVITPYVLRASNS